MVKFIRYNTLFKFYENIQPVLKYSLIMENKLPCRKVLVIAPHEDDEAIGCGGTIYKHAKHGGIVDIVYCTKDSNERNIESLKCSKMIGASSVDFLNYKIESLEKENDFPSALSSVIERKKPEIVFLPFLLDNHTDHRAVNKAFLKMRSKFDFIVYAYPVWMPVYPNVLTDISDVWQEKKKLIECYQTQLATRDYVKMSHSLASYWGAVKGKGIETAETFLKASYPEYLSLIKKVL